MKTKKEYLHASDLGKKLQTLGAEELEKLHDVGGRCKWCQETLDTWLLIQIYKRLSIIESRIQDLGPVSVGTNDDLP